MNETEYFMDTAILDCSFNGIWCFDNAKLFKTWPTTEITITDYTWLYVLGQSETLEVKHSYPSGGLMVLIYNETTKLLMVLIYNEPTKLYS